MRMEVVDNPLDRCVEVTVWIGHREIAALGSSSVKYQFQYGALLSDRLYALADLAKEMERFDKPTVMPHVHVIRPKELPPPDNAIDAEFEEVRTRN